MKKYFERPMGEMVGDDKPMSDKGGSKMGEYSKSLGEASKSDLNNGFCCKESIVSDTKSDKGYA